MTLALSASPHLANNAFLLCPPPKAATKFSAGITLQPLAASITTAPPQVSSSASAPARAHASGESTLATTPLFRPLASDTRPLEPSTLNTSTLAATRLNPSATPSSVTTTVVVNPSSIAVVTHVISRVSSHTVLARFAADFDADADADSDSDSVVDDARGRPRRPRGALEHRRARDPVVVVKVVVKGVDIAPRGRV
jgi:hypothetical protein